MSQRPDKNDATPVSWFADFFLLRTTFALLLALLLVVGGVLASGSLVKEALPDLAIPQATVATEWGGADPQTIEQEITEKLEKELRTLKGLKSITSSSFDSFSIIAVEFDASAELSEAMQLLRAKVNDAESELPREANRPHIEQVSVDDRPILSFTLFGGVGESVLSRVAEDLEDRLERVPGVNEIVIGGMREAVVVVQLRPDRVHALGLSPISVRDAIRNASVDMPWGEIESDAIGASVRFFGRFRTVEDLRGLPVARLGSLGQSRIVRLGEIAEVRRDLEAEKTRAFFSWEGGAFAPTVELSVKKVPGSDTIAVIAAVREELERATAAAEWPPQLAYQITQDESEQIWESLTEVLSNGWQAMIAVFLILFVLLSWREGIVAGLCVPLTFLGGLVVIWAMGFSLNQLVIIGMVLALGLLVDVFILMMEGMHEGLFVEGLSFDQAAVKTVRRYGIPAASGQLTTILALAPLAAIGGVAGKFIRVLPITAIACLSVAFVVAIFVAVPLSRLVLGRVGKTEGARETRVDRLTARLSAQLRGWSLRTTLASRWRAAATVGIAATVFVLSAAAFSSVPSVMYTKADGLKLGITVELPPSTTLATSQKVADRVGEVLRSKPYLESVVKLVGRKSPMAQASLGDALAPTVGENFVGFSCVFVPREERDADGYVLSDGLRSELREVIDSMAAGASLVMVPETGQPSADAPIQIDLLGDDMGRLREMSNQVQSALRAVPGAVDVRDNLGQVRAEIKLVPKREAMDFYGLTEQELAAQVRFALGSDEVAKFAVSGLKDDLSLQLGMAWPSRGGHIGGPTTLEELAMVRAFTPNGETVPLLSVLDPVVSTATLSTTHRDGRRSISVLAKDDGRAPQSIVEDLLPELDKLQRSWPQGYSYAIGGEAQETAETFGSAGIMLALAIVLVFAVLVLQFGSFSQSFVVLITVPLALIGTFLGFFLMQMPFSFFAMVGVISLIGIVVNDSIVMVDTMNHHLADGLDIATAAGRGAADRLRPIISTSLTTIVGLIPLALSDPMWRPLCYAIIFGLVVSTVTSIVVVPCLYLLFTRRAREQAA